MEVHHKQCSRLPGIDISKLKLNEINGFIGGGGRDVIISNVLASTWLKQNLKLKVSATDCVHTKSWDISLDGHNTRLAIHEDFFLFT